MKTFICFLLFLVSCGEPAKDLPRKLITTEIRRVVRAKEKATKTDYGYEFNAWGLISDAAPVIQQQPDVHDIYYLVFTDRTNKEVSFDEYLATSIGDTVIEVSQRWQYE